MVFMVAKPIATVWTEEFDLLGWTINAVIALPNMLVVTTIKN